MQCLTPITVHKDTEKESTVPCGKCAICRSNRRSEWITRLRLELLSSEYSQFNTLTYNDDNLRFSEVVDTDTGEIFKKMTTYKRDVQLFLKRLRKIYYDVSVRYFIISEYGDNTLRPHWHGLFFISGLDLSKVEILKKWYDDFVSSWSLGNVQFGDASIASITYCTKYMFKYGRMPFGVNDLYMLCSRKPPIGSVKIQEFKDYNIIHNDFSRVRFLGVSSRLPRLFRDKWKEEYLSFFDECSREDELSKLKSDANRVMIENFEKLKEEYIFLYGEYNEFGFQDFLTKKLENYKKHIMSNYSKHDKL